MAVSSSLAQQQLLQVSPVAADRAMASWPDGPAAGTAGPWPVGGRSWCHDSVGSLGQALGMCSSSYFRWVAASRALAPKVQEQEEGAFRCA